MSWSDDFQLPDAPYPHQPTDHGGFDPVRLTYEERALLGEITAYGAIIEQIAAGILRGVKFGPRTDWSTEEERYGRGMRLGDTLKAIKAAAATDPAAAKWAEDAITVMNERHEFVHTAWIIRVESLGLMFGPRLNPRSRHRAGT